MWQFILSKIWFDCSHVIIAEYSFKLYNLHIYTLNISSKNSINDYNLYLVIYKLSIIIVILSTQCNPPLSSFLVFHNKESKEIVFHVFLCFIYIGVKFYQIMNAISWHVVLFIMKPGSIAIRTCVAWNGVAIHHIFITYWVFNFVNWRH